jgi:hypothetical protein
MFIRGKIFSTNIFAISTLAVLNPEKYDTDKYRETSQKHKQF